MTWFFAVLVAIVAPCVGVWLVRSWRVDPPRPGDAPAGPTFPRCRTCGRWPGPSVACPRTGNAEEPTDGCRHHTLLEARAAERSEA